MTFVAVLVVFVIVQFWGSAEFFHRDGWFRRWLKRTREWFPGAGLQLAALVIVPVLVLWLVMSLLKAAFVPLYFLVSILLLLYSLGRGNYTEWLEGYRGAAHRNDSEVACDYAVRLGVDVDECNDWPKLHHGVLRRGAYLGFERWFAPIFWFAILGGVGAVFYRLTCLASQAGGQPDEVKSLTHRLLWILEWPAARLLGVTLALAGNFVGCIHRWQETLLSTEKGTAEVIESCIHGALNVNQLEVVPETITEQEVDGVLPLLSRSLILWLCGLAILSVV